MKEEKNVNFFEKIQQKSYFLNLKYERKKINLNFFFNLVVS